MSSTIKQAIEALKSRVADAYTAIVAKGGTLPVTQDSANLPAAIASIPSGDEWDIIVKVAPSNMANFLASKNNVQSFKLEDGISPQIMNNFFYGNTTIKKIDFPKVLPNVTSATYFFDNAQAIESPIDLELPSATSVSGLANLRSTPSLRFIAPNAAYSSGIQNHYKAEYWEIEFASYPNGFAGGSQRELKFASIKGTIIGTFNSAFYNAQKLVTAYLPDLSGVTNVDYAFDFCYALENLYIDGSLPDISLAGLFKRGSTSACDALSHDSLIRIIDALPTTTSGYTLGIGSTNINKLSAAEQAVATAKGWTLA